jgi:hypothetical protein
VVTDESGRPLSAVTVVNVFTQQGTTTGDNGYYTIAANPGDMIAFSYVGYKTVKKIKPLSVIIATVNVIMEPAEYQLKEFQIHPAYMTQYQIDSAERRSIYKVPLRFPHANPFNSPISAIAEKFVKISKEKFRFQKEFTAGETEKFIDTRYSPELVNELTGFTGDTIGHFMYAYPMPYDFARTATDLEIKMWIRNNYREWIKKDSVANKQETLH